MGSHFRTGVCSGGTSSLAHPPLHAASTSNMRSVLNAASRVRDYWRKREEGEEHRRAHDRDRKRVHPLADAADSADAADEEDEDERGTAPAAQAPATSRIAQARQAELEEKERWRESKRAMRMRAKTTGAATSSTATPADTTSPSPSPQTRPNSPPQPSPQRRTRSSTRLLGQGLRTNDDVDAPAASVPEPPTREETRACADRIVRLASQPLTPCMCCSLVKPEEYIVLDARTFCASPLANVLIKLATVPPDAPITPKQRGYADVTSLLGERFHNCVLSRGGVILPPRQEHVQFPAGDAPHEDHELYQPLSGHDDVNWLTMGDLDGDASSLFLELEYDYEERGDLLPDWHDYDLTSMPMHNGVATTTTTTAATGTTTTTPSPGPTPTLPAEGTRVAFCQECYDAVTHNDITSEFVCNGNWGLCPLIVNDKDMSAPGALPAAAHHLISLVVFNWPITRYFPYNGTTLKRTALVKSTSKSILATIIENKELDDSHVNALVFIDKRLNSEQRAFLLGKEAVNLTVLKQALAVLAQDHDAYKVVITDDLLAKLQTYLQQHERAARVLAGDDMPERETDDIFSAAFTHFVQTGDAAVAPSHTDPTSTVTSHYSLYTNDLGVENDTFFMESLRQHDLSTEEDAHVTVHHGNDHVSLVNPGVLEKAFPHVFASGGSFMTTPRPKPMDDMAKLRWLAMSHNAHARDSIPLLAAVFTTMRTLKLLNSSAVHIVRSPRQALQATTEPLERIKHDLQRQLAERSARASTGAAMGSSTDEFNASTATTSVTAQCAFRVVNDTFGGSTESREAKTVAEGLVGTFGFPHLFVSSSINFSTNGALLVSINVKMQNDAEATTYDFDLGKKLAARMTKHPMDMAVWEFRLKNYIALQLWGADMVNKRMVEKALIRAVAVIRAHEDNGRYFLHTHDLVFLAGLPMTPREFEERLRDSSFLDKLVAFFEGIMLLDYCVDDTDVRCPHCDHVGIELHGTGLQYGIKAPHAPPAEMTCPSCFKPTTVQRALLHTVHRSHVLINDPSSTFAAQDEHTVRKHVVDIYTTYGMTDPTNAPPLDATWGGSLDLTNKGHVAWLGYLLCNQQHSWTHHETCWKGFVNRGRVLLRCRMRMPAEARETTGLNESGAIATRVSRKAQWLARPLIICAVSCMGNNDTQITMGTTAHAASRVRYTTSYTTKVLGGGFADSDVANIMLTVLRKKEQHEAANRPRSHGAATTATPKELANTAVSAVLSLAVSLMNYIQIGLPMACLYILNGTRFTMSCKVERAPLAHVAAELYASRYNLNRDRTVELPMHCITENGQKKYTTSNSYHAYVSRPDTFPQSTTSTDNLSFYSYLANYHVRNTGGKRRKTASLEKLEEPRVVTVGLPHSQLARTVRIHVRPGEFTTVPSIIARWSTLAGAPAVELSTTTTTATVASTTSTFTSATSTSTSTTTTVPQPLHPHSLDVEMALANTPVMLDVDTQLHHQHPLSLPMEVEHAVPHVPPPAELTHDHHHDHDHGLDDDDVAHRDPDETGDLDVHMFDPEPDDNEPDDGNDDFGNTDEDKPEILSCVLLLLCCAHRSINDITKAMFPGETFFEYLNRLIINENLGRDEETYIRNRLLYMDAAFAHDNNPAEVAYVRKMDTAYEHNKPAPGAPGAPAPPSCDDDDAFATAETEATDVVSAAEAEENALLFDIQAATLLSASREAALPTIADKIARVYKSDSKTINLNDDALRDDAESSGLAHMTSVAPKATAATLASSTSLDAVDATVALPPAPIVLATTATVATEVEWSSDLDIAARDHFGLNHEQAQAFIMLAAHTLYEAGQRDNLDHVGRHFGLKLTSEFYDKPLYMLLTGTAGTGKSVVISSVRDVLNARGLRDTTRVISMSAIAAVNVGGHTAASAAHINHDASRGRGEPGLASARGSAARQRVRNYFDACTLLVVDEVYTMGIKSFLNASTNINIALGRDVDTDIFGGIRTIVLCGDHHQLPPVRDTPLYHVFSDAADQLPPDDATEPDTDSRRRVSVHRARQIFAKFDTCIVLQQSQRFSNSPLLDTFSREARTVQGVSQATMDAINKRVVDDLPNAIQTPDLMVLTFTRKRTAMYVDALNSRVDPAHLFRWGLHDERKGTNTPYSDAQLHLLHENAILDNAVRVPPDFAAHIGMRVTITINHNTGMGICNGAVGTIDKLVFPDSCTFTPTPRGVQCSEPPLYAVLNMMTRATAKLDGLLDNQRPVVRAKQTGKASASKTKSAHAMRYKYSALPLSDGRAATGHSKQGATLSKVLVDDLTADGARPPPELLPVLITRVRTEHDLYLAAPIHGRVAASLVESRQSQGGLPPRRALLQHVAQVRKRRCCP